MAIATTLAWVSVGAAVFAALAAMVGDAMDAGRLGSRLAAVLLAVAGACVAAVRILIPVPGEVPGLFAQPGVASVIFAVAALAAWAYVDAGGDGAGSGGPVALVALSAGASAVLCGATDAVVLFISIELLAICGYALVASSKDRRSEEAAVKYFVQGAVAAGALALAVAVMVGLAAGGTTYASQAGGVAAIDELSRSGVSIVGGGMLALMLLVGVVSFKLSAFPFHSWAPDAYEAAPPEASAFLATAPKAAVAVAAVLLFKQGIYSAAFPQSGTAFAVLAIVSIVYGNLAGLKQRSYTRMLGYSGIAYAGYLLIGLATANPNSTAVAVMGATYALGSAAAFLAAASVRRARPGWDGAVAGMRGLGRERPWLSAQITVAMLSLTGIPLTAGFWGKFVVFADAVRGALSPLAAAQPEIAWRGIILVVVAVIGSVVSFGYYGRVIRSLYLEDAEDDPDADDAEARGTGAAGAATSVAVLALLLLGIVPLFAGLGELLIFLS